MFALSTTIWLFLGAGLLFATLVIALWLLGLVKQVRKLLEDAKTASARLQGAQADVRAQVQHASEQAERISGAVSRRKSR